MAAQDRVKEHAVLQTIGYTGWRILGLVLAESILVSLAGGLLGIAACMAWLSWQPLTISTEGASIDFLPSPYVALWGLGLATGVGVVAGLIPAWQAGFADITRSLRQ
jgi:putative ABC transport system permease protein